MTLPKFPAYVCVCCELCCSFFFILSFSFVGLVFLIVFGFLFVLQFFCMLVHRFTTLSHFIARAPYRFGQSYRTSISFLSRHLDPDEEHLLTEARNSETVSISRIKRDKSRKRKGTPGKTSEKSKLLPNHHSNDVYSESPPWSTRTRIHKCRSASGSKGSYPVQN